MEKSYRNNSQLALDIMRGQWLLHNPGQFARMARLFLERRGTDVRISEKADADKAKLHTICGDIFSMDAVDPSLPEQQQLILVIPMHGVLTKYDNCVGCATMEVVDIIEETLKDRKVCGYVLDIDSPGGAVNAIAPLVAAIKKVQAEGIPIVCHVDQCGSAAYWIATQTDAIFTDNMMSTVGSVGAYMSIVDDRENKQTGERTIDIYAPESKDKNRAYREALDGDCELAEKQLSDTVALFTKAVKEGRKDLQADADGVLTGAMFMAPKAIELGMVDGMNDLQGCIENVYVRASI